MLKILAPLVPFLNVNFQHDEVLKLFLFFYEHPNVLASCVQLFQLIPV